MNPRQRSYDSFDKTNTLLKLTNSYYHNKNLDLIKNRKSQYTTRKTENLLHKSKYLQPFKDYFVIKENKSMANKINDMKWRPVKPKINRFFLDKESRIQGFRQRYQNINKMAIQNENLNYKKRIKDQKPFISTKFMDKDYKENHVKTLQKLRQVNESEGGSTLPPIRTQNSTKRKYYHTEGSKGSQKNEGSSDGDDDDENKEKENESGSGDGDDK